MNFRESLSSMVMSVYDIPCFHGVFLQPVEKSETVSIETAGVYVKGTKVFYVYNKPWFEALTDPVKRFIHCHEAQHLLRAHCLRGDIVAAKDPIKRRIANIAMDMIINSWLKEQPGIGNEGEGKFIETPSKMWCIPDEYTGEKVFEPLYIWLLENQEKWESPDYMLLDEHMDLDDIPEDTLKEIVKELIKRMRDQGKIPASMDAELAKIFPQKKDYLREIKRCITTLKGRGKKVKTYTRLPRIPVPSFTLMKGKKYVSNEINVLLDTSGSMWGLFEKALSYCAQDGTVLHVVQCDTEVSQKEVTITSKKELSQLKIHGGGGTILQPGIKYVVDKLPKIPLLVLTDGFCEGELDFTGCQEVLVIYVGEGNPTLKHTKKVNAIHVDKEML